MLKATNFDATIVPTAVLAQPLSALEAAANTFAAAHALGRDNLRTIKTAAQAYADAFQLALVGHADREVILAYAQDATRYARYVKHCAAMTIGHTAPSTIGTARALFAGWRVSEQAFAAAGYRAVDFVRLYDSANWPGVSRKIEFLIYNDFFAQREEGEEPVLHAEAAAAQNPCLVNPDDLAVNELVVAWAGSRWVVGTYQGKVGGSDRVRSGDSDFLTCHLIRYEVAVKSGVWPFKHGTKIAAWLNGEWQPAEWITYHGDAHLVCPDDGVVQTSDRVHILENAVTMGLLATA